MKPSTSSYIAKLTLMNICTAFLLGMGYGLPHSTLDLSSESEKAQQAVREQGEQVAPLIEHALDRVNESNSSLNSLFGSWFSNSSTINCADCKKAISGLRYEQCDATKKDGYLEKQIDQVSSKNTVLSAIIRKPINPYSIIKPTCLHMAMEGAQLSSARYKVCAPSSNRYNPKDRGVGQACIGEEYFKLVNNSFDLVSNCMKDYIAPGEVDEMKKLDVRAVFAMINVESSFHVNAVSETGAGGIGQFTSDAIKDVNANELSKVRNSLESNPNRMCGRMSIEFLDKMAPIKPEASNSCERISIKDGNPVTNMIYTFAYMKKAKENMERSIFKNKEFAKKFSKLSAFDLAKVKRAMMIWSHNTGPAGTLTPTKALLKIVYRNKPVTDADSFINQLQQYMQKFPAEANRKVSRRNETSGYFPKIVERINKLEKDAGGGTCVN